MHDTECTATPPIRASLMEDFFSVVLLRDGGWGCLLRGRSRPLLRGPTADVDGG